ncbi:hypothetical protein RFI_03187 [Reticulomyxa filosa]|uniref:Uncharacterized protein n=1 Tax=Reticulomyxa filosa TaxID=46433 RepID=X6P6W6_RETFI|nr:hypothetical protein RFI_03187 [Reticulomyxa filosa]|eukprot:ETO33911.1 hypothetical protein RFI_03187 [Reticulomyxa filosa]
MDTLSALSSLDGSRLPCGVLEEFVLALDRNAVLTDENKENEKNDNEDKKKKLLVPGSSEHTYYRLLQLSNEIGQMVLDKSSDSQKLETSIKAFDKIVAGLEEKAKQDSSYEIPSDVVKC